MSMPVANTRSISTERLMKSDHNKNRTSTTAWFCTINTATSTRLMMVSQRVIRNDPLPRTLVVHRFQCGAYEIIVSRLCIGRRSKRPQFFGSNKYNIF
jgi:hypothetical protein